MSDYLDKTSIPTFTMLAYLLLATTTKIGSNFLLLYVHITTQQLESLDKDPVCVLTYKSGDGLDKVKSEVLFDSNSGQQQSAHIQQSSLTK